MRLSTFFVLFLIIFYTVEAAKKKEIPWECGAEYYTKAFSEQLIDEVCPFAKDAINKCCVVHDNCYGSQTGRANCDAVFCDCLQVATKAHPLCNRPLFCNLVEEFGDYAYRLSHPTAQVLLKLAKDIWDEL